MGSAATFLLNESSPLSPHHRRLLAGCHARAIIRKQRRSIIVQYRHDFLAVVTRTLVVVNRFQEINFGEFSSVLGLLYVCALRTNTIGPQHCRRRSKVEAKKAHCRLPSKKMIRTKMSEKRAKQEMDL